MLQFLKQAVAEHCLAIVVLFLETVIPPEGGGTMSLGRKVILLTGSAIILLMTRAVLAQMAPPSLANTVPEIDDVVVNWNFAQES